MEFSSPLQSPGLNRLISPGHCPVDPEEESEVGKGSLMSCIVVLAFSGIGAGILSLPWAMSTCGLLGGGAALAGVGLLSNLALQVLLDAQARSPGCAGYTVVSHFWPYPRIVDTVIAIDCFGALVVFVDYFSDSIISLTSAYGVSEDLAQPAVLKAAVVLLVAPLSLPRSIAGAGASLQLVCMAALVYVVALVVFQAMFGTYPIPSGVQMYKLTWDSPKGMTAFLFAYVCHVNVFAVRHALRDPTAARCRRCCAYATCLMFGAYAAVATCGYIVFGDKVTVDVLRSFPPSLLCVSVGNFAMCTLLIVCLVLVVYPVRAAVLGLVAGITCRSPEPNEAPKGQWLLATIFICITTGIVAILFPSLVQAIDLLGGFCAPCLIFLFPAVTLNRESAPVKQLLLATAAVASFVILVVSLCS